MSMRIPQYSTDAADFCPPAAPFTLSHRPALLVDVVMCKRGLDWTLVELNKAVSLSACTTMLMSFLPAFGEWSAELLFQSMSLLWAHSVYSSYKFYGGSVQRLLRDKPVKQLSIALGVAGQLALSAGFWGYVSDDALVLGGSVLGLAHFYSMEIDYKGILQVRHFACMCWPIRLFLVPILV